MKAVEINPAGNAGMCSWLMLQVLLMLRAVLLFLMLHPCGGVCRQVFR
ncbi:MAG: hypothetical protein K9K78_00790 [Spirochaetales bacterium]|nr:hypothetical protein [Spirochaetales bacterium]